MPKGGNVVPSVTNAEHIGPDDTGDNISAKRVASYAWNSTSSQWERLPVNLAGGLIQEAYDYIALTEASTTDTWVFKTGGSGGTTVATVTITYTDSNKGTISTVART